MLTQVMMMMARLYPYYYYLHGLEISMTYKGIEELEQRIKDLEKIV